MQIINSEILSTTDNREKKGIVFQFTTDTGLIIGPIVEHRPTEEDHQAFVDAMIPALEESLNQPEPTEEELLQETLKAFSDNAIATVFKIDVASVDAIKSGPIVAEEM